MEKISCFIVIHTNYADGVDAYAFRREQDAIKSVSEDAETVMSELDNNGYKPRLLEKAAGSVEIYVPDSGIYYEWVIVPSHLE